jgi:hypothetical protein
MLDSKIVTAVEPLVPVCVPGIYTGEAEEYCTFNYSEIPVGFGDNRPHAMRYLVQLHWFLPLKQRPHPKKKALRRALMSVRGFTTPTITDATDGDGQHYVYEFEAVDGDV